MFFFEHQVKFKWGLLRQNFVANSNMSNTEQNVKIVIDDKMYFITEEVNSSDFNEISQVVHEEVDEGGQDDDLGFWSQHDNALRDLLVFLVQKHCIEDMMDSKMKSQCWVSLSYWMNLDKQYLEQYDIFPGFSIRGLLQIYA